MSKPTVSAAGGAMPAEGRILSQMLRRGFLRQLCHLPLIGGGVALLGAPTAVAEPVTPDLIAAYRRWLVLEHYLLLEECPHTGSILRKPSRPSMAGWSDSCVREYLGAEQHLDQIEARFRSECCNFRFRAGFTAERPSPADRFFLNRDDLTIVSPPASTRAALVMSAVGCEWRA
jgi:hypothetical protein